MQTFFLASDESLLISMSVNTVRTASFSTDFRLLQTSFLVPTLWTSWIQQTNWDHDHGQHAYVFTTAVVLTAGCVDYVTANRTVYKPTQPSARSIDIVVKFPDDSLQLRNGRISSEQSFTAHMPLLMAVKHRHVVLYELMTNLSAVTLNGWLSERQNLVSLRTTECR